MEKEFPCHGPFLLCFCSRINVHALVNPLVDSAFEASIVCQDETLPVLSEVSPCSAHRRSRCVGSSVGRLSTPKMIQPKSHLVMPLPYKSHLLMFFAASALQ